MSGKVVLYILGKIISFLGFVFSVPLLLSFAYADGMQAAFSVCMGLCFLIGWVFTRTGTPYFYGKELTNREGILTVVLSWVIAALFSALPFVLTGTLDPAGAFFEAMSGLTTTGATALAEIEGLAGRLRDHSHFYCAAAGNFRRGRASYQRGRYRF